MIETKQEHYLASNFELSPLIYASRSAWGINIPAKSFQDMGYLFGGTSCFILFYSVFINY